MKVKLAIIFAVMAAAMAPLFCGGAAEAKLVNTETISLNQIEAISITYGADSITLLQGDGDSLIVKEYMSSDNRDYYALVSSNGKSLAIEQGRRPAGPFHSRVEIIIPRSYNQRFLVVAQSGSIRSEGSLRFSYFTAGTSSGSIRFNSIEADTMEISSSSGSLTMESLKGKEAFLSTSSGSIHVNKLEGAVTARSSSGSIHCTAVQVRGDLILESSSGSIHLSLPENTAFQFKAETNSGSIRTPFSDSLVSPFNSRGSAQGLINGDKASSSAITVDLKTTSGSINVSWS